ncbi:MAG: hypothetical protein V1898_04810 [Patescibacteria group bacterium]
MYLIFDNLSSENIYLALADQKKILSEKMAPVERRHGEVALIAINNFLRKNKVKPTAIKALVVNIGPGQYTKVRLAVLIANTWAYILNIKLYGIKKQYFLNPNMLLKKMSTIKPLSQIEPFYAAEPTITKSKKKYA